MRIDKFLKDSRIIKRRTVAKEACDSGRVKLNDRLAKAGDQVGGGDLIEISFGDKTLKVQVKEDFDQVINPRPQDLYEVID